MGLPRTPEAKMYYRAAKQRFEEAEVLLKAGMKTGAVYLAGYTVECFLKVLILEGTTGGLRKRLFADFRGRKAHDIERLGGLYRQRVGGTMPRDITRHLTRVATWETELRYKTVLRKQGDADEFIKSVAAVATWADGRI